MNWHSEYMQIKYIQQNKNAKSSINLYWENPCQSSEPRLSNTITNLLFQSDAERGDHGEEGFPGSQPVSMDKSFPNGYNTAVGVCQSIKEPVTTEILLNTIDNYRWRESDLDLMPPPHKMRRTWARQPPWNKCYSYWRNIFIWFLFSFWTYFIPV